MSATVAPSKVLDSLPGLCTAIPTKQDTTAAAIVDLLDRVLGSPQIETAYCRLVQELESHLSSRAVLLGLSAPNQIACNLTATTSHWTSNEKQLIEAAMSECLAREKPGVWPPDEKAPRHTLLAHKRLAEELRADLVFSLPLLDRRGTRQGVLIVLANDPGFSECQRAFLRAAAQPIASTLATLNLARNGWFARQISSIGKLAHSHKFIAGLLGLGLAIGGLSLPMPYRMACKCQLEPAARRFVAAPFDGTLERALVEPGDLVEEQQVLAVMDGREIRWELAGLVAEKTQAAKERDGHMAKHDFGSAQLAKLEMDRLQVREQLLTKRSDNLEIRSPQAGVVVVGDLKKSHGMPLGVGEKLFEIAPLEEMLVEIAIPEADIPWAKAGQQVEIVLDAYPETNWTGTLTRIHPRAELRDEEHVFIGEVRLSNPEALLRPGMRGRVKIQGPTKTLGWNLFHKPWYELRYWLGW